MYFLDSNILFYSLDQEATHQQRERALALWGPEAWISAQVLAEVCNVFQKKRKMDAHFCLTVVQQLRKGFQVLDLDADLVESALHIKQRYRTSYYDSQILAAALRADCQTVYSEDMQNGQVIFDRLTILNPFL